jgi:hypothetical protein
MWSLGLMGATGAQSVPPFGAQIEAEFGALLIGVAVHFLQSDVIFTGRWTGRYGVQFVEANLPVRVGVRSVAE